MSLESIIDSIICDAKKKKDEIIAEAKAEADKIIQQAKKEGELLYKTGVEKEKAAEQGQKQKLIVTARLECKKDLLKTKQELIGSIFQRLKLEFSKKTLKKEKITHDKVEEVKSEADAYLDLLRYDYETETAKILFG